ncbi:tetratricopeptide repeat protein [Seonamhaeicola marinus]|uniref:Tetratricopeptide repeat protein n=1 Tax=Seonamhaeicola marinus TaxID=1912246 RepID=A0A5D0J7R2_9FLAO|nr:hypothetical protein [Seonamhaeicola marinus]TYA92233.1 hypothetical protein FUA24_02030 [Seonamhaeicola marinus]
MKTKLLLSLSSTLIIVLIYLKVNSSEKTIYPKTSNLVTSSISCTPSKFLLKVIDSTKQISPLFKNLGNLHFPVTTKSKRAQAFFDQGLKLAYAFNHAESHRSFMEAARLDPDMAMAYWGQAFALGPNINDPLPSEERKEQINKAIDLATSLLDKANTKEKALINALAKRYSKDLDKDVSELNLSYMNAMENVASSHPNNANILILYAASVMNTVPWNYWDKDGNPSPNINKAKTALEKAITLKPENPGAHHYYIHMVELPFPDMGVKSADQLASLMPGAGHIVHMPSHIYIRVGRYKDAVIANQKAILADEDYISQCFSQGLYPLAYYPHNIHFLWSSASLLGDSELAIDAAKKTAEKVPVGEYLEMPFLQDFASTPLLAYVRFGKWNDILTFPAPKKDIKHLNLIRHYARGIAFIKKGNIEKTQKELAAIKILQDDEELESLIAVPNNPTSELADIAYYIVAGELAASQNNYNVAIANFKNAVEIEDRLAYTEPSPWHIPTRQNLGNALMNIKKYEAAETIYNEDLAVNRQNGWSLIGLYNSLKAQNKLKDAEKIKREFNKAWEHADIEINSSVF